MRRNQHKKRRCGEADAVKFARTQVVPGFQIACCPSRCDTKPQNRAEDAVGRNPSQSR